MARKSTSKETTNPKEITISFAGIGSYNYIKEHGEKGLFWTISQDGKYLLLDTRTKLKESSFDTISEMQESCNGRAIS